MPRLPINYANTLMYKIFKPDETDADNIYIGHTTDFSCRKTTHKSNCNNPKSKEYNTKKYDYIRANGGWECFLMRQIEEYPCKNRREAEAREEELRIELKAKLNSIRAFITPEIKKEQQKEYYKNHAEELKEQQKEYYKNHAEELKEQQKNYNKKHAEQIKEYKRQYYKDHKEERNEKQRQYRLKKKQEKLALTIEPVIT